MLPEKIWDKISELYGSQSASAITASLERLLERYQTLQNSSVPDFLTERDVMLITYADSLHQPGREPLKSLSQFCRNRLDNLVNIVHILPFFPYSSDDGFSVIDYRQVNPHHGDWPHIKRINQYVDLCFDLVINHASTSSHYFKAFLADAPEYRNFFIEMDEHADTASVVRPRTSPLLHCYSASGKDKWCWTTFSQDQADLNFQNPAVLLEMLDILLFYVSQGARIIRLDAIAYLWKQLGTSCVHLPQCHLLVQLIRVILDEVAPHTLLLSETNFPHEDNISYFGDGSNEAQMVYNFPMPPLVLFSIASGNAAHLTRWARSIKPVSQRTTFLNFTASHDGIGVRPAASLLSPEEFQSLIRRTTDHGGQVSYKNDNNGQPIPYELNINYFDALNDPGNPEPDEDLQIDRFLLSQSIALVFLGIPAIYIHSLVGSRNWTDGPVQTGRARSINRERLELDLIEQQLHDPLSRRGKIFHRYARMISLRRQQRAFHPCAPQQILDLGPEIFALARTAPDRSETIIALHNVTGQTQQLTLDTSLLESQPQGKLTDLITDTSLSASDSGLYQLSIKPYRFAWLRGERSNRRN